jgi:hypothetical protein
MLVKNEMIKDVNTIHVNSLMLETGNRRDPIMVCASRPGRPKMDFSFKPPQPEKRPRKRIKE